MCCAGCAKPSGLILFETLKMLRLIILLAIIGAAIFKVMITYRLEAERIDILSGPFVLMSLPFSQISGVFIGNNFTRGKRMITIWPAFALRQGCLIHKTSGFFRSVLICPKNPQELVRAVEAFRARQGLPRLGGS